MTDALVALVRAAIHDDVEAIRGTTRHCVNQVDVDGKTPLFYALYRSGATGDDDPRVVQALLELGADANLAIVRRDGPRSPLHQAAIRGMSTICQTLIDAGADPNEPGLLHAACESGLVWLAELALENAEVDSRFRGATPMHEACYSGSVALVELLLRRGGKATDRVQGADWHDFDCLKFAIIGNSPEVVSTIVAHGVEATDEHLRFLVDPARTWALPIEEAEDVRAVLLGQEARHAPGAPALRIAKHLAATLGEDASREIAAGFELVEPQTELPPSPGCDVPGAEFPTATLKQRAYLHDAATYGWTEAVRRIPADVNVNMLSTGSATNIARPALCVAADRNLIATAAAFLDAGADPRVCGADNRSAYRTARTREMRALLRSSHDVW